MRRRQRAGGGRRSADAPCSCTLVCTAWDCSAEPLLFKADEPPRVVRTKAAARCRKTWRRASMLCGQRFAMATDRRITGSSTYTHIHRAGQGHQGAKSPQCGQKSAGLDTQLPGSSLRAVYSLHVAYCMLHLTVLHAQDVFGARSLRV